MTQRRRGQTLENYVTALLLQFAHLGIHGHKNNPVRTIQGNTILGEPFDYELFMPDAVHLFDAKECSDKNLHWNITPFTRIHDRHYRQLCTLHDCTVVKNVLAYFLVYFINSSQPAHIIAFDTATIKIALKLGRKYLTPEDGQAWTIPDDLGTLARSLEA